MNLSENEIAVALDALALSQEQMREHLKDDGIDSLAKVKAETKLEILNKLTTRLLEQKSGAESIDSIKSNSNYGKARVLLVDDVKSMREHIKLVLKKYGFCHFDEVDDGHSAIEKLRSKSTPYDLVLCDMNMPTVSGLDVLRLIRQEDRLSTMPFIMVTSDSNKVNIINAMKAGVSDYIAKPIDEEKLIGKISKLLL